MLESLLATKVYRVTANYPGCAFAIVPRGDGEVIATEGHGSALRWALPRQLPSVFEPFEPLAVVSIALETVALGRYEVWVRKDITVYVYAEHREDVERLCLVVAVAIGLVTWAVGVARLR